jgi:hypothetical protein
LATGLLFDVLLLVEELVDDDPATAPELELEDWPYDSGLTAHAATTAKSLKSMLFS